MPKPKGITPAISKPEILSSVSPLTQTYYLPPPTAIPSTNPSLLPPQFLTLPPVYTASLTTWPPLPPLTTTTSDPITITTWGPLIYESKPKKPKEEKERKTKNGYLQPFSSSSDSSASSDEDKKKPKGREIESHKSTWSRKKGEPTRLSLSGQEELYTTETVEHLPASDGGGVRKTYVTTTKLTTIRTERKLMATDVAQCGKQEGNESSKKKEKENVTTVTKEKKMKKKTKGKKHQDQKHQDQKQADTAADEKTIKPVDTADAADAHIFHQERSWREELGSYTGELQPRGRRAGRGGNGVRLL